MSCPVLLTVFLNFLELSWALSSFSFSHFDRSKMNEIHELTAEIGFRPKVMQRLRALKVCEQFYCSGRQFQAKNSEGAHKRFINLQEHFESSIENTACTLTNLPRKCRNNRFSNAHKDSAMAAVSLWYISLITLNSTQSSRYKCVYKLLWTISIKFDKQRSKLQPAHLELNADEANRGKAVFMGPKWCSRFPTDERQKEKKLD